MWSNGDKTLSITLKPGSGRRPTLSAKDLEFTIDEIKAAVKESPANWAAYTPGYFPDTLISMSTPNASTLVVNMLQAGQPDLDGRGHHRRPGHARRTSGPRPPRTGRPGLHEPGERDQDLRLPQRGAKSVNTYATNPLWQDVYGPYKLSSFNATTGGFTMVPNPTYSGPHADPQSNFVGVPFTSDAAQFNAIKSGSIDVDVVPPEDAPELSSLKALGYDYFGLPDFGNYFATYNFQDKTGDFNNIVSQLYFRQAMQHLEDQQGQIKAYLNGAGDPAYGPIPLYPQSPFLPANADEPLPVQRLRRRRAC